MSRIVRVPVEQLARGERALDRKSSHYLLRVLRLGRGAHFVAFDPAAHAEADAEIVREAAELVCRISEPRAARTPGPGPVLVQAFAKGDKVAEVLRAATALGAARILLVHAERSISRPEESERLHARWRAVCLDAARQCGRPGVPEVDGPFELSVALERLRDHQGPRWCFEPSATQSFRQALGVSGLGAPPAVLIGPEGGWSESELALASGARFELVRFGPWTLRSELAGAAVLGALLGLD